jgi:hypothetical protein
MSVALMDDGRNDNTGWPAVVCHFVNMYSDTAFCGAHAIDTVAATVNAHCIGLCGSDIMDKKAYVDTVVRRILHQCAHEPRSADSASPHITYVVDTTNCHTIKTAGEKRAVVDLLRNWTVELTQEYSMPVSHFL